MSEEMKTFDWDDFIEDDGEERSFITLEEGDYDFEVYKFERGYYTAKPGGKLPNCNMAIMTLKVSGDDGDAYVSDRFYLTESTEWRISAFFRSIGMKKHGEKLRMKWDDAVGCTGRAHFTKDPGNNPDVYFNNVKYYIDPPAQPAKEDGDPWS